MPVYFRFGIGPFRFSYRLSQTQAQKRAAARQRAARLQARQARKAFDPARHVTVTQAPLSVTISANTRGLTPEQEARVVAHVRKLEANYADTPVPMPALNAEIARAARTHAAQIAQIVAMTTDQDKTQAISAIRNSTLRQAAIRAVLLDESGRAGS
jgi:hypothetical protein